MRGFYFLIMLALGSYSLAISYLFYQSLQAQKITTENYHSLEHLYLKTYEQLVVVARDCKDL